MIRILISIALILVISWSVDAHQPVLNTENRTVKSPYIIEEPEISKAIFSELMGEPHYYRIDSDSRFKFYVGITAPKIDNCPISKKFSFEVLDKNFELIERKDGENFNWWPWYEKHGEKWYWIGPEIGQEFKSNRFYNEGTYYIRVYNKTNTGQYVLAVGDEESFPISVIIRMLFTMSKINSKFWDDVTCP
ncbi:MAG: hypothetical protein ACJ0DG_04610 [bacterium]